ncbi:MAG TPA: hypothetical protein VKH19_05475 [Gemmatimonadaceae bacterium]|nr:hypothetical protein [Gemmatimonadaceae bacterium]
MPTHSRVRRKRGPAIAWAPTQDSYYELARILRSATGATPLYLTQAAILEFEAHLRESSSPLPFGLLAGDVCLCPQTKLEYLLIDTVARARIELTDDDPYAQLADELQSLAAEQAKQRKIAIGWYLGGMADDLTLDGDVTNLHRQLFPERWQVALVRGETSGIEHGAFLRFEDIWNRWYSIPFFEFAPERGGKNRERRTALRWANYRADEPTRPLDEHEGSETKANVASRSWWRSRGFSASLQPLPRSARGKPARPSADTPPRTPEPAPAIVAPAERARATRAPAPRAPAAGAPGVSRDPARVPAPAVSAPAVAAPAVPAPAVPALAMSAPARHADPSAPPEANAPVATAPRTAAMTSFAPPEPLNAAPSPQHAPEPLRVESTERMVNAFDEVEVAPEPAAPNAHDAPLSDVQHVFIDGNLVPVPVAQMLIDKPGKFGGTDGVRISSLFIGALLLVTLFGLYLIAS